MQRSMDRDRRMVSAAATIGFRRAIRSPRRHETRETALKAGSKRVLGVVAAILLIAGGAEARITRIEIVSSEPAFGGASFGDAGAYVRLVGRVHGELDPADPANSIIQDIPLRRATRAAWSNIRPMSNS